MCGNIKGKLNGIRSTIIIFIMYCKIIYEEYFMQESGMQQDD